VIAPESPAADTAPVFISFASEELQLAQRIVERLERNGIRCWIASRDIEVGASYPAAITAAVTGGSAMLLLLTEASNASPHVLSEVELAFNARKPILPLRLTPVALSADLQYFLGTTQWFDAGTEFDDDEAARLQARLQHVIAHKRGFEARPTEPTPSKQWIAYAAAALALLAVIGTALYRSRRVAPAADSSAISSPQASSDATGPREKPGTPTPSAPGPGPESKKDDAVPHLRLRVNPKDGQTYVWIPPGRFTIGCSPGDSSCEKDEFPSHAVRIRQGFWMSRTEVTKGEYAKGRGSSIPSAEGDLPAADVDWQDAKRYCTAVGGRLPTENEWEYAARAGSTSSRYDVLADIGWYADNSDDHVHPVAQKTANTFGLFDMLGNVYEWVADRYFNAYDEEDSGSVVEPLAGNASGVARGGGFESPAKDLRASNRWGVPPDMAQGNIGFRCVADR
jgi:hypothetical protein